MKNEELLVKRALEGETIDTKKGFFKKINLSSLRKELDKLSESEWVKLCHMSSNGSFYGFGCLELTEKPDEIEDFFAGLLEARNLWESEEDEKLFFYSLELGHRERYIPKRYWEKYANNYKDKDGKSHFGLYTSFYLTERDDIAKRIIESVHSSRKVYEYAIEIIEED
ncbi:MAG: hypothetical protein N4Q99_00315 [Lactobacillus iners]|nr:hypothetical protein [Lactobacillus iners]MCT7830438.1 hypothetical protein [Lactobacillus iners]